MANRVPLARYQSVLASLLAVILAACGGGGGNGSDGSSPPPPPPPPPPPTVAVVSIGDASVVEGSSGTVGLSFSVTLSEALSDEATLDYATADDSATAGADYVATSGTLTIAAGDTAADVVVDVMSDTDVEGDETFTLALSNPSTNLSLGTSSALGRILDDDSGPVPLAGARLNDTGVVDCATDVFSGLDCDDPGAGTDAYPRQDAEFGRDVTANADLDGRAGFAFTKLDGAGTPLADQSADYPTTPWACVRDNVTGLVWEVKSSDGGLHDASWTYSWFDDSGFNAQSGNGDENLGLCDTKADCDTEKLTERVNAEQLCGYRDWRLPTRAELLSIVDYGNAGTVRVDAAFFPNTMPGPYWSRTAGLLGAQWALDFVTGDSDTEWTFDALPVRLVRGGF